MESRTAGNTETSEPGQMTLILGGARSGKSDYAERLAAALAPADNVLYVATAQAWDDEMRSRIARHQAQRPSGWRTLESPLGVGPAIEQALARRMEDGRVPQVVLLDCMTLLTSNVLVTLAEDIPEPEAMAAMEQELQPLLNAYGATRQPRPWAASRHRQRLDWIVVSNEVGMGIVPPYPLGRVYRDVLGRVNRRLAAVADHVYLMIAGLPQTLKGRPSPLE